MPACAACSEPLPLACLARQVCLEYLERYFTLICFSSYVSGAHFPPGGPNSLTFGEWLGARRWATGVGVGTVWVWVGWAGDPCCITQEHSTHLSRHAQRARQYAPGRSPAFQAPLTHFPTASRRTPLLPCSELRSILERLLRYNPAAALGLNKSPDALAASEWRGRARDGSGWLGGFFTARVPRARPPLHGLGSPHTHTPRVVPL